MPREVLYGKYARFYDKIYSHKKYKEEVEFIKSISNKFGITGKNVLDMACGTGTHAKILANEGFNVTGADIHSEMLEIARTKTGKGKFIEGSMQSFKSKNKFDIILCLFTSINYNKDVYELESTIKNFYNLAKNGGIIIFDLGVIRGREKEGRFIHSYVDNDLQIKRISQWSISKKKKNIMNADSTLIIKERGKTYNENDKHELGIFSTEEVKELMEEAGFSVSVFDDYTLRSYGKHSKKAVFVGQKN